MSKKLAIKIACSSYDYKWPKELFTGTMYFDGYTITIEEFNEWAVNFK